MTEPESCNQRDPEHTHASAPCFPRHGLAWTLSLLAVPVLYVLTLPVLTHYLQHEVGYTDYDDFPKALRLYYKPADWIYGRSPLKDVLSDYSRWWYHMLAKKPPWRAPAP